VTSVTGPDNLNPYVSPNVSLIQYAPHGAIHQLTLGNQVVETTEYSAPLQVASIEAAGSTSLWMLENFYCANQATTCTSNNGNVVSQRLTAPKIAGNPLVLTTTYGYDGVNRDASPHRQPE